MRALELTRILCWPSSLGSRCPPYRQQCARSLMVVLQALPATMCMKHDGGGKGGGGGGGGGGDDNDDDDDDDDANANDALHVPASVDVAHSPGPLITHVRSYACT